MCSISPLLFDPPLLHFLRISPRCINGKKAAFSSTGQGKYSGTIIFSESDLVSQASLTLKSLTIIIIIVHHHFHHHRSSPSSSLVYSCSVFFLFAPTKKFLHIVSFFYVASIVQRMSRYCRILHTHLA